MPIPSALRVLALVAILVWSLAGGPSGYAQSPLQDVRVLSASLVDATVPGLSASGVAFRDYRGGAYRIYYIDLQTGQEQLLASPFFAEVDVATSGSRVAWVAYPTGSQADVYSFNLSTGATTRLTTDAAFQNHPRMHGDLLVWQDYRNAGAAGTNADIYLHDFAAGSTSAVTTNPALQDLPAVWGRRVVWQDYRHAGAGTSTADIYLRDLDTGVERRLTTGSAYRTFPAIWEHRVVWEDYRNGTWGDIYLYDLQTNTERAISTFPAHKGMPAVFGDWVLWVDYRNSSTQGDLYGFNLGTNQEYPLLLHPAHQEPPKLFGSTVVWQDYRNGRLDLYQGTLGNVLSSTDAAPSRGDAVGALSAHPNPFHHMTTLTAPNGIVRGTLEVFDVLGRRVLRREVAAAEHLLWRGDDDAGNPLPNGLYVARLSHGSSFSSAALMLAR